MPTTEEYIENWTQIVHVLGNLARASRNRRHGDIERLLAEQEVNNLYHYVDTNALYPDGEQYATFVEGLNEAAMVDDYGAADNLATAILVALEAPEVVEEIVEKVEDPEEDIAPLLSDEMMEEMDRIVEEDEEDEQA
jgi:hypothetical protein